MKHLLTCQTRRHPLKSQQGVPAAPPLEELSACQGRQGADEHSPEAKGQILKDHQCSVEQGLPFSDSLVPHKKTLREHFNRRRF